MWNKNRNSHAKYVKSSFDGISIADEDSNRKGKIDKMSEEIVLKVQEIIVKQLNVDKEKVVPAANFIDDLNADSLDTVELVMALEEEFNIEIPEDAAEKIKTVGDAINYITSQA